MKYKVLIIDESDIFHLTKKELTAYFSWSPDVTKKVQWSWHRISHMENGGKYSKIM